MNNHKCPHILTHIILVLGGVNVMKELEIHLQALIHLFYLLFYFFYLFRIRIGKSGTYVTMLWSVSQRQR